MSDYLTGRGRRADPRRGLRLAALTAVIAGVVLLAIAAFLLSYEGIHSIARKAGVSATLASLYPLIFDAMLVIACAAILALRGAGWLTRVYVWLSLFILLGAVAGGDALHAMRITLPAQPARAVVAVTPWVLLLLGFGLWLAMLRQVRRAAAANAQPGGIPGQVTAVPAGAADSGRPARSGRQGRGGRQGRQGRRAAVAREPTSGAAVARAAAGGAGAGSGTGTWTARPAPRPGPGPATGMGHPPTAPTWGGERRAAMEETPAQQGQYGGGHHSDYVGDAESAGSPGYPGAAAARGRPADAGAFADSGGFGETGGLGDDSGFSDAGGHEHGATGRSADATQAQAARHGRQDYPGTAGASGALGADTATGAEPPEPELAEDDPAADHSVPPSGERPDEEADDSSRWAAAPGSDETSHFPRMRSRPTPPQEWGAEPE
jgi:uncharacterized protein DUF2637